MMFIYCFDEEEKEKLDKTLILSTEIILTNKKCWIFTIPKDSKFNFSKLDKSKCLVSNKIRF